MRQYSLVPVPAALARGLLAFTLAAALGGCTLSHGVEDGYLREDGTWDVEGLAAAVERASGEPRTDLTWYPLIWMDLERFEALTEANSLRPEGYEMHEVHAAGPFFLWGSATQTWYDDELRPYERQESRSLLWFLWSETESRIVTPYGLRIGGETRMLLGLLNFPSEVVYQSLENAAPPFGEGPGVDG